MTNKRACYKFMKRRLGTFLALLFLIAFKSCTESKEGNILLLGTVHEATPNLNADSIYTVLKDFKPDLILIELDSTFFYEDFTFRTLFNGNEIIAVSRYKMNFPKTEIRPIEFEGREEYRQQIGIFPEITYDFAKVLEQLHSSGSLTEKENYAITRLFFYDSLNNNIKAEKLSIINQKKTDVIIDSLNFYKYNKLKELSNKYPAFHLKKMVDSKNDTVSVKDNFDLYVDFEMNKRNNALAQKAANLINAHPNKRIIILVGFAHKSYILRYLKNKDIECISELQQ
jgi:hypothetical protein